MVNTIFEEEPDKSFINFPLFYLAKSIDVMGKVDAICFIKDWENARGCKIEHDIAVSYGVEIIEL